MKNLTCVTYSYFKLFKLTLWAVRVSLCVSVLEENDHSAICQKQKEVLKSSYFNPMTSGLIEKKKPTREEVKARQPRIKKSQLPSTLQSLWIILHNNNPVTHCFGIINIFYRMWIENLIKGREKIIPTIIWYSLFHIWQNHGPVASVDDSFFICAKITG